MLFPLLGWWLTDDCYYETYRDFSKNLAGLVI